MQLRNFSSRVLREDIPARNYISEFADWERAFSAVLDLPYGEQKKLLVIDGFPYMCRGIKAFPSILQNLWDSMMRQISFRITLIELGIVEREFSVDAKIKEQANSGRGTYRLTDHFFRFLWVCKLFSA